jgi:hypothetical protein
MDNINQCDGCQAGIPLKGRMHIAPYPSGNFMCTADDYYETKAKTWISLAKIYLKDIYGLEPNDIDFNDQDLVESEGPKEYIDNIAVKYDLSKIK